MEYPNFTENNSPSRKVTLSCRVLPEQKFLIAQKAKKLDMTLSQYVEAKVLREDNFAIENQVEQQIKEIQQLRFQLQQLSKYKKEVQALSPKLAEITMERDELLEVKKEFQSLMEENEQLEQRIESLQNSKSSPQETQTKSVFSWKWIMGSLGALLLIVVGWYFLFRKDDKQTQLIQSPPTPPSQNPNPPDTFWNGQQGIPPIG